MIESGHKRELDDVYKILTGLNSHFEEHKNCCLKVILKDLLGTPARVTITGNRTSNISTVGESNDN